jgi:NADH dehydrogenase
MQQYPLITVVGGSGFVGRHLIKKLASAGYRIRVLCRDTVAAEFLTTGGTVGQVVAQYADITRPETLVGKFEGSWAVVNLVSILYESGRQKFRTINTDGARAVAQAARHAGAERFVQISALGADKATDTKYGSTKIAGEQAVLSTFAEATILRPSIIIGPEDEFFQRFARMSMLLPALPLIGGGKTKFQPTLVSDVADAILAVLSQSQTKGKTYSLGGPKVFSFKDMMEQLKRVTRRDVRLVPLPTWLAKIMGVFCSLLPLKPMITYDQVKLLAHDNVVPPKADGYAALGITPGSVTAALPSLLSRFIKG